MGDFSDRAFDQWLEYARDMYAEAILSDVSNRYLDTLGGVYALAADDWASLPHFWGAEKKQAELWSRHRDAIRALSKQLGSRSKAISQYIYQKTNTWPQTTQQLFTAKTQYDAFNHRLWRAPYDRLASGLKRQPGAITTAAALAAKAFGSRETTWNEAFEFGFAFDEATKPVTTFFEGIGMLRSANPPEETVSGKPPPALFEPPPSTDRLVAEPSKGLGNSGVRGSQPSPNQRIVSEGRPKPEEKGPSSKRQPQPASPSEPGRVVSPLPRQGESLPTMPPPKWRIEQRRPQEPPLDRLIVDQDQGRVIGGFLGRILGEGPREFSLPKLRQAEQKAVQLRKGVCDAFEAAEPPPKSKDKTWEARIDRLWKLFQQQRPKDANGWWRKNLFDTWRQMAMGEVFKNKGLRQALKNEAGIDVVWRSERKRYAFRVKAITKEGVNVEIGLDVDHAKIDHSASVEAALRSGSPAPLRMTIDAKNNLQILTPRENQTEIRIMREYFERQRQLELRPTSEFSPSNR
jgi:hypothetical protein